MKKIAFYGKGGIGKSTTTSNVSAALAEQGLTVMQIGCDPKSDSTKNLTEGVRILTVLDAIKEKGGHVKLEDIVVRSDTGVLCVEVGGPPPGIGCAGRGIIAAFERLDELKAFQTYEPDFVLYDVLGDVVCGGFAMPIRGGYAEDVYIVTSGEMMALYAADNINRAVAAYRNKGYARVRGVILNERNVKDERATVEAACAEMGTSLVACLPRSPEVQQAEELRKTVVAALPDSAMAERYRSLARMLLESC